MPSFDARWRSNASDAAQQGESVMRYSIILALASRAVLAMGLVAHSATATGATFIVNDDLGGNTFEPSPCDTAADSATIQGAVAVASEGDEVRVCPGIYAEQVEIEIVELKLTSIEPLGATISAPSSMVDPKTIVHVNGATNVMIQDFVISGPGPGTCNTILSGIFVGGSGSATIQGNEILDIRDDPLSGCQNGLGILVGRGSVGEVGTATIAHNRIARYQKGAVVVDNAGSDASITDNEIIGEGQIPKIAQNGIQVSRNATADVKRNIVDGNWFTGAFWSSTGILVFESQDVTVQGNNVVNNQVGIAVQAWAWTVPSANDNRIIKNTVTGADWGISVFSIDFAGFTNNDVTVNNNKVTNNTVIGPSAGGIVGIEVGSFEAADTGHQQTAVNNKVINNKVDSAYPVAVDSTSDNTAVKVHANKVITP